MNARTITTGKVRFSYAHIFTPSAMKGQDKEKYSLCVLIPKTDKATIAKINAAIDEAKKDGAEKKWGGKVPAKLNIPLRDGDVEKEDDDTFAGCFFMNCKSDNKPGIFDENVEEVINPAEVYSGCYGRVNITFYPYDSNGNRGVAVGLNHVQKLEDGEPLGGAAPSAKEAFGDGLLD